MIKFQQKNYALPLVPILTGIGIAGTGAQMVQAHKQGKEAEEQAEETQARIEKQNELIKQQNKRIEKLSEKSPDAARAVQGITQREFGAIPFSVLRNVAKAKNAITGAASTFAQNNPNLVGGLKDVGIAAKKTFGKDAMNNIKMGGLMAGSTYVAGKYIQHDMKKNNMDVDDSGNLVAKQYTIPGSVMTGLTATGKFIKNNPKTILGASAMGGVPVVLQYKADKQMAKDQIEATQEERQYAAVPISVLRGMVRGKQAIAGIGKNITGAGKKIADGWNEFNSHKMQSITGTASQLSSFGMGGTKNIQKFGERLVTLGSGKGGGTANETIKKAGEWIQNHKTAANAISIVPGAIAAKATWDGSQKVVDKIGHTVDSGAYKYTDSKNQQIE